MLFAAVLAAALGARLAIDRRSEALKAVTRAHLAQFSHEPALGAYAETRPRLGLGPRPYRHAVLLLHGYSASPATFERLIAQLEARGLPYHAPRLTGFGLDDFHLLEVARGADWRRDARAAYDIVAALADTVSIVAVSFGTLLAAELAQELPVKHLVLVGPYFHLLDPQEAKRRAQLANPWVRRAALALLPYVAKPRRPDRPTPADIVDPEASARFFQYPTLPLHSLLELWAYPRTLEASRLRCEQMSVLWGEREETSDVPAFLGDLRAAGLPHRVWAFPRSGHNLFDDHDGEAAASLAAALIAGEAVE